jgi:putative restriction endonuclease
MSKAPSVKWTREHQLIALNLYCKLPFGKLHRGNPVIKEVAAKMGRTASSLALKLTNFASLDPVLQARGIGGMPGASIGDKSIWHEFHGSIDTLGAESEQLLHDLLAAQTDVEVDLLEPDAVNFERPVQPSGPTESIATVRVRRGQQFFRQAVLSAYGVQCCVTGINVPRLLVASHIKPWRDFPNERLDPRNGLCLSALHDAAFDAGLITLNTELRVVLSKKLKSFFPQQMLEQNFLPFEGKAIHRPTKLVEPDEIFLSFHRMNIFVS